MALLVSVSRLLFRGIGDSGAATGRPSARSGRNDLDVITVFDAHANHVADLGCRPKPVGCEFLFNASKRAKIGIRTSQVLGRLHQVYQWAVWLPDEVFAPYREPSAIQNPLSDRPPPAGIRFADRIVRAWRPDPYPLEKPSTWIRMM